MRAARPALLMCALALLGLLLLGSSMLVGPHSLRDTTLVDTLLRLRGSRALVAYLSGAALAVAGVLVQGLFRNPLASPDVLGTTAGASFAGKLTMLLLDVWLHAGALGGLSAELFLPLGCLFGAGCSLLVLLAIARVAQDHVALLLSGFLLSSLFLSMGSLVTSLAQESWELGRAVVMFALGSVSGAGSRQIAMIAPIVLVGTLASALWARPLDLLLSGEDEARVLGLDVRRARRWCIVWAALLTAGAVSVGGNVGFVGLVVPHAVRRFCGATHRLLVPASALLGGAFLVACDLLVRVLPVSSEVPLGVVTGLIGAPLFLWLVLRGQRGIVHG